jgi:hypothetical protein
VDIHNHVKTLFFVLLSLAGLVGVSWAGDAELVASYTTRLSAGDHVNSDGARLQGAADIIQQDRANYHKWKERDDEDEGERFFTSAERRAQIGKMLERGSIGKVTAKAIITRTPLVQIDVYRSASGSYFMDVIKLDD